MSHPESTNPEYQSDPLEDTREFTEEEVAALGLYIEFMAKRPEVKQNLRLPESTQHTKPDPGVFPWGV